MHLKLAQQYALYGVFCFTAMDATNCLILADKLFTSNRLLKCNVSVARQRERGLIAAVPPLLEHSGTAPSQCMLNYHIMFHSCLRQGKCLYCCCRFVSLSGFFGKFYLRVERLCESFLPLAQVVELFKVLVSPSQSLYWLWRASPSLLIVQTKSMEHRCRYTSRHLH